MDYENHPKYREMLEWVAHEVEHLNPNIWPRGKETTEYDVLRVGLVRLQRDPELDTAMYNWIEAKIKELEKIDRRQPVLDELNRRLRPSDN